MRKATQATLAVLAALAAILAASSMAPPAAQAAGWGAEAKVCAHPARTANRQATAETKAIHRYLWRLTCDSHRATGVISGQNVGHGSQAADPDGWFGYPRLVAQLAEDSGQHVGVVGVDYEHDQVFTFEQLTIANDILIDHERLGGLVSVTWSPLSPWLNDELDIEGDPGFWTDTRTDAGQLDGVDDLRDILDPDTAVGQVWQRKLARIADALTELRDAGVVVLWRPMQEMNGFWFWWGTTVHGDDSSVYKDIWRHMYEYFTYERDLDNLLWVYSPAASRLTFDGRPVPNVQLASWAYPGSGMVDIVAGTSYHDDLLIPDYQDYLRLPEVIGEAEYSAGLLGGHDRDGDLDTTLYATRLKHDYPAVAYWVSWHDFPWSETENAWLSLASNLRADELLNHRYVITAAELPTRPGPSVHPE